MRNCSRRVSASIALCACVLGVTAFAEGKDESRVETRVVTKKIPHDVKYEFSRLLGPGRLIKARDGQDGELREIYRVFITDGKVVGKELVATEKKAPVDALFHMGKAGFSTSRGSFSRHKVLEMEATAYDPSPRTIGPKATGRTYTGMKAQFGVVAVDPRVIPLKTLVFVEGYGFAIASDIGSAIKGNRIDLCYMSRATALKFGRKKVKVHILRAP